MNRSFAIILGIVLLLAALIPVFYKVGDVPDVNWGNRYSLQSKDPNGLWVMMELLRERYGEENVIVDPLFNAIDYESDEEHVLYLAISNRLTFSNSEAIVLEEFVNYFGHSALLISSNFSFDGNLLNINSTSYPMLSDSIEVTFPGDSTYTGIFKNYDGSFKESAPFMKGKLYAEKDELLEEGGTLSPFLLVNADTSGYRLDFDGNSITMHSMPSMFTNSAALQDFYMHHINKVFSGINASKIVVTLPTNESFAKQSPIGVLLKNKSLKAAYYFLIFTLLTLLFFATKRRQPRVKTFQPLANTSMESAQSLARMHQIFGSNEGFIDVLERNFYNDLKSTFGVSENDPNFEEKMAKKSGVDMLMMEKIIKEIKRLKAKCSDSQLIQLRNTIVNFNKKIEDG